MNALPTVAQRAFFSRLVDRDGPQEDATNTIDARIAILRDIVEF